MTTDFNKPITTDAYAALLAALQVAISDLARGLDPTVTGTHTNTPTWARRFNDSTLRWEKYNGTSWIENQATYAISINGTAANIAGAGIVGVPNGGTGVATLTGLVKGNGAGAMSAATVRTDYAEPTAALATGILKNTTATGAHTIAVAADFPTLNQSTTGNATTAGGLAVATGVNSVANQIVRTDASGYAQMGYINSGAGNEGNASSPARVWGTNGSDAYMRTYLASSLNAGVGASQTWQDVAASRTRDTTYTNSTGKTIVVKVSSKRTDNGFMMGMTVSGVPVSYILCTANYYYTQTIVVPSGGTYIHDVGSASWALGYWAELR